MTVTDISTLCNAAQDIGHQVAAIEARRVLPMRDLVVRRPVDVVEDGARQPPSRKLTKVVEVMAIAKPHPCPFPSPRLDAGSLIQSAR